MHRISWNWKAVVGLPCVLHLATRTRNGFGHIQQVSLTFRESIAHRPKLMHGNHVRIYTANCEMNYSGLIRLGSASKLIDTVLISDRIPITGSPAQTTTTDHRPQTTDHLPYCLCNLWFQPFIQSFRSLPERGAAGSKHSKEGGRAHQLNSSSRLQAKRRVPSSPPPTPATTIPLYQQTRPPTSRPRDNQHSLDPSIQPHVDNE